MSDSSSEPDPIAKAIGGLALRSIGPAFMGGRIADIAIHPDRPNTWYLGVGSGGVWKSTNAGITWKPIFDDQPSYSIGCVRIDPNAPDTIWVGTGEAVSGRHVAWGSGVYRSIDGGDSWQCMGLQWSEHVSDILIDPRDSAVVYVAAEGPLWSSGGERGLYKTVDAGATWERVLHVDADTGVTSAVFAPDDPDTIYAATYQRRRRVWSFVGGGPGSGIHVSNDAGATWDRITAGLPTSEMGRIGLAVTPADPSIVYATVEAADAEQRGFHRSTNRGRTWQRRSGYISGGTGPHYYQEIFASPSTVDLVYQVDVFLQVTHDGGKTFANAEDGRSKHSDNHVVWIDPGNDDHLIVGCDAGLTESFDAGAQWRHVSNLPISQFYRVAVDDSVPFTNVLGGAQDLGTLRGPTRTAHVDGVRNQDWWVVLGADGYHAAFDPDDGDISYVSWQVGNMLRHNMATMELVDIQPQAGPDDPPERWNWDAPLVTSAHASRRIFMASQRVWRSDDRGESWTAVSGDLTADANRYELAAGERVVSVDSLYDHLAMSYYSTISAMAESPLVDGLLYVGTDDGRLHATDDGGATWRECGRPPGMSDVAFVNDLTPSLHDPDHVIVCFDDHKSGDYTPHVCESHDRGRTWTSIRGDLPDGIIVWSVEQDHEVPELVFAGTEHGLYATLDGGAAWHRFTKEVPTIAFRDLAIQRRDNDLIGATFGRGFYVLDDYSPLRSLARAANGDTATLFPVRDTWWYQPHLRAQAAGQPTMGATAFRTPNPDDGALFTYHLPEPFESAKAMRRKTEKAAAEACEDVAFAGWNTLRDERLETEPAVHLVVRNAAGEAVRAIPGSTEAGLHRVAWDLRGASPAPVDLTDPGFKAPWEEPPRGELVAPGAYTVELVATVGGVEQVLAGPESFDVVPVPDATEAVVRNIDHGEVSAFRAETMALARRVAGMAKQVASARDRVKHLRAGIAANPTADLGARLDAAHRNLEAIAVRLLGDPVLLDREEPAPPSIKGTIERVASLHGNTTGPPTDTQRRAIGEAGPALDAAATDLDAAIAELTELSLALDAAGGPYTPR